MIRRLPPFLTQLLSYPFRLFFVLAALNAVATMALWLALLAGGTGWSGPLSPMIWHGHEMLFGYTAAVVAGFILTAVSNWTGIGPWRGWPLALLGGLWLSGRLVWLGAAWLPPLLVVAVDFAFVPALAGMLAVPILASGNRRQLVFLGLLAVLAAGNLLIDLELLNLFEGGGHLGLVLAVNGVCLLIAVMGGRVIPMFTGNVLRQRGLSVLPVALPWLERLALPSLALVALLDLVAEGSPAAAAAALAAMLVHGWRLAGWRGSQTRDQPILWVLHFGYGWLVLGLALKAAAVLVPEIPPSAALHALTAGAIGTLTLGIMSRVTLGHTGRPFRAPSLTVLAYWLVTAAALIRVVGPILLPSLLVPALVLSALLWLAAFAAFLVAQAGMLIAPRADGRPG